MKVILAVMCTTLAVMKIRPEKKIPACTGFEPMTSAIPNPMENSVFEFSIYDIHSVKTSLTKLVLVV